MWDHAYISAAFLTKSFPLLHPFTLARLLGRPCRWAPGGRECTVGTRPPDANKTKNITSLGGCTSHPGCKCCLAPLWSLPRVQEFLGIVAVSRHSHARLILCRPQASQVEHPAVQGRRINKTKNNSYWLGLGSPHRGNRAAHTGGIGSEGY